MMLFLFLAMTLLGWSNAHSLNPYDRWRGGSTNRLDVNLGYERYHGEVIEHGYRAWKGIRFAAPPVGELRFQKPQVPVSNNSEVIQATAYPNMCPQFIFNSFWGDEDCLFLNVVAPANASNLPVFVYIHGGGYTAGSGAQNHSDFIYNNNGGFLTVFLQYRLGALGFLSSEEVHENGQLNAGLLDIELALQWVQAYIHLFGGNPHRVTVAGESAGAGSVMLLSMLRGGSLGETLFEQLIGASPYLPRQYKYNDVIPESHYRSLARRLDCDGDEAPMFDCLVSSDVLNITQVAFQVSNNHFYYDWGLVPVTDGVILQDVPSQQLLRRQVNGRRILVGNNANEGYSFTPQNITTSDDFLSYISQYFDMFSQADLAALTHLYPSGGDTSPATYNYSTVGYEGPTALTMGDFSNGEQQRANNLQAEAMFVCPAYWLAQALPEGWKYEFSVPPAAHAFDVGSYFYNGTDDTGFIDDFKKAFQGVWGNFVVSGDPRISQELACGSNSLSDCSRDLDQRHDISGWKPFNHLQFTHLSANITGGVPGQYGFGFGGSAPFVPQNKGPGLYNSFTINDAYTWEGGRGHRCDALRNMAPKIPG